VNFEVWIAWIRTILPLYPLMHERFRELSEAQKKKTIDDHIQKHKMPSFNFEKKIKAVFNNCTFLKTRGQVFEHTELSPQVTKYSSESNFARPHFD
jgi:hypothetical protein